VLKHEKDNIPTPAFDLKELEKFIISKEMEEDEHSIKYNHDGSIS
jgi:hypothetical protein